MFSPEFSVKIVKAASRSGFKYDWSAIPPSRIQRRLKSFPIYQWTIENWREFESSFQARKLASSKEALVVIPQTGGAIDFNTSSEIFRYFEQTKSQAAEQATLFNLVIYQETLSTYFPRLQETLDKLLTPKQDHNVALTFDWASYRNTLNSN